VLWLAALPSSREASQQVRVRARGQIKAGLVAAAAVLVATEWLMISHAVSWLVSAGMPH
jgi:hypothetical protein